MSNLTLQAKRSRLAFIKGDSNPVVDGRITTSRFFVGFDTTTEGPGWKINNLQYFLYPQGSTAADGYTSMSVRFCDAQKQFSDGDEISDVLVGTAFYTAAVAPAENNPSDIFGIYLAYATISADVLRNVCRYGLYITTTGTGFFTDIPASAIGRDVALQTSNAEAVALTPGSLYNAQLYVGSPCRFAWNNTYDDTCVIGVPYPSKTVLEYRPLGYPDTVTAVELGDHITAADIAINDVLGVSTLEWRVTVTSNSGLTITSDWKSADVKRLTVLLDGLYPAEGARAVKSLANTFGWSVHEKDGAVTVTQTAAIWRWRTAVDAAVHEIAIADGTTHVDVPAGTFSADSIQWQVQVATSIGTVLTSDWTTVTTLDALSAPVCVSPSGQAVTDADGVPFVWRHVSETGTAQTGAEVSASSDGGAHWSVLYAADTAEQTTLIAHGVLSLGQVLWRVRTKNADGAWGAHSENAYIIVRRPITAPVITLMDGKPLPRIEWQHAEQMAYRVTIGAFDSGWRYGTEKIYQHGQILADGTYAVTVRVQDALGEESAPAEGSMTVANAAGTEVRCAVTELPNLVRVSFASSGSYACFYVLRDGVPVARCPAAGSWDDLNAAGPHTYCVRALTSERSYTDSAAVVGVTRVVHSALRALDETGFLCLALRRGGRPAHTSGRTRQESLVHYFGRALPEVLRTDFLDIQHSYTYSFRSAAEYRKLYALAGRTVIYKDCTGLCYAGTLGTISADYQRSTIDVGFTLTQVDWDEELDYDVSV